MKVPYMPDVPIDLDDKDRQFLESLDDKLGSIDVARVEGDNLHVLCNKYGDPWTEYTEIVRDNHGMVHERSFSSADIDKPVGSLLALFTLGTYWLLPSTKKATRQRTQYETTVSRMRETNQTDIKEKVKGIRIYQGSLAEVQRDLGKDLEIVQTEGPATFIRAKTEFWLAAEAYNLGADAVVHYQPGSAIGTPVKFSDSK